MKRNLRSALLTGFLAIILQTSADTPGKCPVSGEPVNPNCTLQYEDRSFSFCCGRCRTKFDTRLKGSLYHKLGGRAAIDAAVDLFYTKVLADKRVNRHFEDVNMKRQARKQKEFLAAAFGGPDPWTGKDMRKAHAHMKLGESDFNAIAEHLQSTLQELKVKPELIQQALAIAASTKDDVLNWKPQ